MENKLLPTIYKPSAYNTYIWRGYKFLYALYTIRIEKLFQDRLKQKYETTSFS